MMYKCKYLITLFLLFLCISSCGAEPAEGMGEESETSQINSGNNKEEGTNSADLAEHNNGEKNIEEYVIQKLKEYDIKIIDLQNNQKILLCLSFVALLFSITGIVFAIVKGKRRLAEYEDSFIRFHQSLKDYQYKINRAEGHIKELNNYIEKSIYDLKKEIAYQNSIYVDERENVRKSRVSVSHSAINKDVEEKVYFPINKDGNNSSYKTEEKGYSRTEYAGLNNTVYFMELFDSNQEACVYKIKCKSKTSGEFDLISLDKIKSSNGWKDVVDVESSEDCTIDEASSFITLELGQCIKIDDNNWKVTQKLKIKISK